MRISFLRAFAGDYLLCRIPLEFSSQPQGDYDEMSDAGRTVAGFDRCNRILAGADTAKKVAHVVAADFEAHGAVGERGADDFFVAGGKVGAIDPDPSVR